MLLSSLLKTLSGFFFELLWRDDGFLCCEFVSVSTLSPSPVSDWGCSCFNDRGPRATFWAVHCVCASMHLCCSPAVLVRKSRLHLVHLYTNPCSTIVLPRSRCLPKNVLIFSSILLFPPSVAQFFYCLTLFLPLLSIAHCADRFVLGFLFQRQRCGWRWWVGE